ncbi:MAG: hypothetical protein HQ594_03810 [Candidatus Omnitrophica bacterium]|nr:hypothetical protein [Candidatus Omnitrophota bacterium]
MIRNILIGAIILCLSLFAAEAFAEITVVPQVGTLTVYAHSGTETLDAETLETTASDFKGGDVAVTYDDEAGAVDLEAVEGSSSVVFGIAKLFLDADDSVHIEYNVDESGTVRYFSIGSALGDIVVTFPDGSRIVIPEDASVSLTLLADNNYDLSVLEGEVEYTDPNGQTRTLTTSSPAILIQGYGLVPDWRSDEIKRNPATP